MPPKAWCKANFDGAAKGNLGKVGVGVIIRNNFGKGIVVVASPLGTQINHYAEARATHYTIKLALDMGMKKHWLKGDSKNVIYFLKEKNKPTWTIKKIIEYCILLLKPFEEVHVAHEYHEANHVADSLANWEIKYNRMTTWMEGNNLPSDINEFNERERISGRLGITKGPL